MRRWLVLLLLVAGLVPASGCGIFRRTEQWKCDNLGLCWFGIRPSQEQMPCEGTPQPADGMVLPGPIAYPSN